MSIWAQREILRLSAALEAMEKRLAKLEPPAPCINNGKPNLAMKTAVEIGLVDIREQYRQKFGRLPHHRMLDSTIMEALR